MAVAMIPTIQFSMSGEGLNFFAKQDITARHHKKGDGYQDEYEVVHKLL